nr:hypothetical protein [Ferrimicrobium acidiphilum]
MVASVRLDLHYLPVIINVVVPVQVPFVILLACGTTVKFVICITGDAVSVYVRHGKQRSLA